MSKERESQSTKTTQHPLEHGLEAPVAIPPAGQRHEDYFPRKNMLRRIVGGTAVVAILAGGGILGKSMLGGEKAPSAENPAPNPDKTVSAPATTGETNTPSLLTPAEAIGQEQTSYDSLNVQPSSEDVERALRKLSINDYSPDEAIIEFGKKMNVFDLGGKIDNESGDLNETAESIEQGDEILAAIFGEERVLNESSDFEGFRNIREMVGNRFNSYGFEEPGSLYNIEKDKKEFATANESWTIDEINTTNPEAISATVSVAWNTNFEAIDVTEMFDNPGIDEPLSVQKKIEIEVVDGFYQVKSLDSLE